MKIKLFIVILLVSIVPILLILNNSGSSTKSEFTSSQTNYISLADYNSSQSSYLDKRVVYFFHAKWCPTCRALEQDIVKRINDLPVDVVIVKVDFDNSDELRKKYGVTSQHTLVQIKPDGQINGKWVGNPSLSDLLSKLQQV